MVKLNMKKYKGLGSYNLPAQDLKEIAYFFSLIKSYNKMNRLLKEINQ